MAHLPLRSGCCVSVLVMVYGQLYSCTSTTQSVQLTCAFTVFNTTAFTVFSVYCV